MIFAYPLVLTLMVGQLVFLVLSIGYFRRSDRNAVDGTKKYSLNLFIAALLAFLPVLYFVRQAIDFGFGIYMLFASVSTLTIGAHLIWISRLHLAKER